MRLIQVSFDEEDQPTRMVVELSARELALIYGFLGPTAPLAVSERAGVEWGNLFSDLAGEIGSIGARFYEDGWDYPRLGLQTKGT